MSEMTFEIVQTIVIAVFTILGIVIAKSVVPFVNSLKLNEEQQTVMTLVETAVKAMEQIVKESGQGKTKKQQVIAFVRGELFDKGIIITEEQLDKLIEAAVYAMKQEKSDIIQLTAEEIKC